jgi:hypothetical protein
MGEEIFLVPFLARLSGRVPAFVEESAQQHGQLRAEMRCALRPDAVALLP